MMEAAPEMRFQSAPACLPAQLAYEKARHEDDLAALADELSDTQRQLQASEAECARLRDANDFLQASPPLNSS